MPVPKTKSRPAPGATKRHKPREDTSAAVAASVFVATAAGKAARKRSTYDTKVEAECAARGIAAVKPGAADDGFFGTEADGEFFDAFFRSTAAQGAA